MNQFNKRALANSIAFLTGIIYIVFYIIGLIAPSVFGFIFDAQFLGANVSKLIPGGQLGFGEFIATLVVVVITAWIFGYIWGTIYNRLNK